MASMADVTQRGRSLLFGVVLIVVGVFVGHALPQNTATPAAEIGTVTYVKLQTGGSGTQFVFKPKSGGQQTYQLDTPTPWQNKPGSWHLSGMPTCLVPNSHIPHRVTIGVITVQPTDSLAGGPFIAWIKCQS